MSKTIQSKPYAPLRLSVLDERLAVCRLDPQAGLPPWATEAPFYSVTRTTDELSVVCPEESVPDGVKREGGWRAFKLEGKFDFGQVGVLASVAVPLAKAGVGIFAVSTFDTDYVFVKESQLNAATAALSEHGHEVRTREPAVRIRPATGEDEGFLWEMLAEAARETSVRAVAENPGTARYVEGWGREGDLGVVAVSDGGERLGAAWVRSLKGENAGYGYVDDETPELAIGVRPEARGAGIGTGLISHLLEAARPRHRAVSLSVRANNPARRLYERLGFEAVEQPEDRGSITMKLNFNDRSDDVAAGGPSVAVRPAAGEDKGFLWEMLYESVHWGPEERGPKPPPEALLSRPDVRRYLAGWGRDGDFAVVALDAESGQRIGAAWYRIFRASERGYGFVDEATPDIVIAVAPDRRGMGVGGSLLDALMDAARSRGFDAISLGVQRSNPAAIRLYEKRGFVKLSEQGSAWTMGVDLTADAGEARATTREGR